MDRYDGRIQPRAEVRPLRTMGWGWRFFAPLLLACGGAVLFILPWISFWSMPLSVHAAILGGTMVWSGLAKLHLLLRFGQGSASIGPAVIGAGRPFDFTYRKRVYLSTTASFSIALVLREKLPDGEEGGPTHRDHLVGYHREAAVRWVAGTVEERCCRLEIPSNGTAEFATGKGALSWIVKVHVDLEPGNDYDFWEEFELPLPAQRQLPVPPRQTPAESDYHVLYDGLYFNDAKGYRVFLPVLGEYLPHLDAAQIASD
jgi:hypothetical protein